MKYSTQLKVVHILVTYVLHLHEYKFYAHTVSTRFDLFKGQLHPENVYISGYFMRKMCVVNVL